ncbi:MAG: hypothetical protein ACW981_20750 [Candidatus Hodarchaeales archaeon]|jgi:hypothetical protein
MTLKKKISKNKKVPTFLFVFACIFLVNIAPVSAATSFYAFQDKSNTNGGFQSLYSYGKLQGHAVYADTGTGSTDWYLNIRNRINDPLIGGGHRFMQVYAKIYVSAYYKQLICGYTGCSTSYYWNPIPAGLVTLSGDYTYTSGPTSVTWQVGLSGYSMSTNVGITGATTVNHRTRDSIDGDFRYIGYLKSWRGFGYFNTLDARILVNLHLSNSLAREYDNGQVFAGSMYYQETWIQKLQVKLTFKYQNCCIFGFFYFDAGTQSFVLGDNNPSSTDTTGFDLVPGSVS